MDLQQGRWTAELDGDFVVFIIGAMVHDPTVATEASQLLMAMADMLDELEAHPSKGLLGYTRHGDPGAAGIWHETFRVNAGSYEAIYQNTPVMGLQRAGRPITVAEGRDSARARLAR